MLAEHVLSHLSYTPSIIFLSPLLFGGGKRVRTDDLMLAKHALSHLSYTPDPTFLSLLSPSLSSGGPGRT